MAEEKKEQMRKMITDWGLPECLRKNKENIVFKFDDEGIINSNEHGYKCEDGNVKFCLYDMKQEKVLFSMDFFKSNPRVAALSGYGARIKLELIYVHDDSFRNKGIASYYVEKLIDYAIDEKVDCIYLQVNANADNFKHDCKENSLSQRELEDFYIKRSTQKMPIKLYN